MDLENVWTVATKDFSLLRTKKNIVYTLVAFPLGMALGLPAVVWLVEMRNPTISFVDLFPLFNSFNFWFIIVATAIPAGMASYSIVGEKVEKSLEPLLATPAMDGEILLGKSIASFLPSIGVTYFGAAIFMILIDVITHQQLGYLFYPNWNAGVFLLLAAPLACLFSVEMNIIVSARVSDVRAANQFGGLLIIPFAALYVLGEINIVPLTANNLLIISAVLLLVDAILFFVSKSTFRREEILTKWK
jgi:ABC-2 type transport system permease protein